MVIGVVTEKNADLRNQLGEKIKDIPTIDGVDIRRKVKDLMKGQMADYFEANKRQLVFASVARTENLPELFKVIKQFKGINERAEPNTPHRYRPEEVVVMIEGAERELAEKIAADEVLSLNPQQLREYIQNLVFRHDIQADSAIDQQVVKILYEQTYQKKLEKKAEEISSNPVRRFGQSLLGLFRRR